jgi:hypothetical protein
MVFHGINVLPVYVPSSTLKDPGWNTHVINAFLGRLLRMHVKEPRLCRLGLRRGQRQFKFLQQTLLGHEPDQAFDLDAPVE